MVLAQIKFSNKNLSKLKKKILEREFIDRMIIAFDILDPMYDEWNNEFDKLYPEKDGYSDEYSNFIKSKQEDAVNIANAKSIRMNRTQLYQDEKGAILGICKKWDTTMNLLLIEE